LMSVLTTLLEKAGPKLVSLAGKTINATSAQAVGAAAGALAGGTIGAVSASEGNKTKGFAVGALTGGLVGRYGGKNYAGFGKGGVDSAKIQAFGQELGRLSKVDQKASTTIRDLGKYVSNNLASPEHLKPIGTNAITGPKATPALSVTRTPQAPVQALSKPGGTLLTSVGNMTRNVMSIADKGTARSLGITGSNVFTRTSQVVGREINEAMHYTKDGFRYKRSVPGKVFGAALGSGAGIGVIEGATTTNPDGSPAPIHKKILKGTATGLSWGLATPLMGAKALTHDIPKMIINPES
jgi:hypothetical protein